MLRVRKVFFKDYVPRAAAKPSSEIGDKPTKSTQTRLVEIDPRLAFQGIVDLLRRRRYQVEPCEGKYILAKHLKYDRNIFIVVASHKEYAKYEKVRSVVIDVQKYVEIFEELNRAYEKIWAREKRLAKQFDPQRLLRDVITAFGWHAYKTESIRHTALERSTNSYDELHIENLLRLLRNTWRYHVNRRKYLQIVENDYLWFQAEFGRRAYAYRSRKRELKENLRMELNRLLSERRLGRLMANINRIHNYFVLTY